jgi:hypothetical protein
VLAGPRAGDSEAAALISGRGKRVMDSIRQEVAEFSHLQDAVAEQTDANFPATLRRMFLVLGVASALADRPSPPALGKNIPLAARLMAVADVYDALISRRVYKEPMDHQAAKANFARSPGGSAARLSCWPSPCRCKSRFRLFRRRSGPASDPPASVALASARGGSRYRPRRPADLPPSRPR